MIERPKTLAEWAAAMKAGRFDPKPAETPAAEIPAKICHDCRKPHVGARVRCARCHYEHCRRQNAANERKRLAKLTEKDCEACGVTKPVEAFWRDRHGGRLAKCSDCTGKRMVTA